MKVQIQQRKKRGNVSNPVTFDARPLIEPVNPVDVRAFASSPLAPRRSTTGIIIAVVVFILALVVLVPLMVAATAIGGGALFLFPLVIMVGVVVVTILVSIWSGRTRLQQAYRLAVFAQRNHMTYVPTIENPSYPGMLFDIGYGRRATGVVRGTTPREVDFANYEYTVKTGDKSSTTYRWRYVAVRLGNILPNIVLDAQANNGFFGSNLPVHFSKKQRLHLEGNFDDSFALYCPAGYERDALYLFTPDVMVNFMDTSSQFDVEIIDDWVFFYTQTWVEPLAPETWHREFIAVQTLLRKIAQWERWRDDRLRAAASAAPSVPHGFAQVGGAAPVPGQPIQPWYQPPPGVAPAGRRLRRSYGVLGVILSVGFGALLLILQFARHL